MKPRTLPATPEMKLARRRSTATTYQLYVPAALGGWANCTVNDQTGELSIHSDWGNWSYQWSPRPEHLGAEDLTEFLAKMPDAESDYVARKLQGGWNAGHRFDGEATAAEMVSVIAKHRLEHGRNAIGSVSGASDPHRAHGSGRRSGTIGSVAGATGVIATPCDHPSRDRARCRWQCP